MKRYGLLLAAVLFTFTLTGCDNCKENIITQITDTLATIGKSGLEKEQVLAGRKAERAAKCLEQSAGDMKKNLGF